MHCDIIITSAWRIPSLIFNGRRNGMHPVMIETIILLYRDYKFSLNRLMILSTFVSLICLQFHFFFFISSLPVSGELNLVHFFCCCCVVMFNNMKSFNHLAVSLAALIASFVDWTTMKKNFIFFMIGMRDWWNVKRDGIKKVNNCYCMHVWKNPKNNSRLTNEMIGYQHSNN